MIQAVVFDLDGLLVDSEPMWFRARSEIFQRFGLLWTEADQKKQMGVSTAMWADYLAQKLQDRMSRQEVIDESLSKMASCYQAGEADYARRCGRLGYCAGKYKLVFQVLPSC
jgi:beta-phosphoglucomutase-like phosphatase (HAD superfamily)